MTTTGSTHARTSHDTTGVHVHRAVRAGDLIAELAELLATDPLDPFLTEVVSVPTPGVERWLTQALSDRLTIAAGIEFPSTHRWFDDVWALGSAHLLVDEFDPWRRTHLTWAVLHAIDQAQELPWAAMVRASTTHQLGRSGRRFATAHRIAGLFYRYGRERPDMLRRWLAGDFVDSSDQPLNPRYLWQPHLWNLVRATLAVPSPAERHAHVLSTLQQNPELLALPERVSIFGLNRFDQQDRTVIEAIASHRELHLWLAHPSPVRWDRQAHHQATLTQGPQGSDPTITGLAQPWPLRSDADRTWSESHQGLDLVSSLAREVVDFQHLLGQLTVAVRDSACSTPSQHPGDGAAADSDTSTTLPVSEAYRAATVLQRVQAAIRQDLNPHIDPGQPEPLSSTDHSVQVHVCHGPDRQIEVLRDLICDLLHQDPTLEPRDIMIMCPDLERFAPLARAAFDVTGLPDRISEPANNPSGQDLSGHPGRRLRLRIADQSLTQINPILALLERLLDLVPSRVTATELIDLCAAAPIASRFRFRSDDLEVLPELIHASGMKWGLDAAHRAPYHLDGFPHNTVAAGIDRMLLGVAWSERELQHLGVVLPLDQVESTDVDRIGRFAEFVARLRVCLDRLAGPHTLSGWLSALREAIDLLATAEPGESWQLGHAIGALHDALTPEGLAPNPTSSAAATATPDIQPSATPDIQLNLGDIRALLHDTLAGRPSRANFRTGSLTLSSLAPMRSVPHRVIFLIGMDDQAFPRRISADGDDLVQASPRIGDRDPRAEDRQLFLDAVMAAEDALIIVYGGRDPRTNAPRPPSIPVGELIDTAAQFHPAGTSAMVVEHPLQPYDPRNFDPASDLVSYDPVAHAAAKISLAPRVQPTPVFSRDPLPPLPPASDPVQLAELTTFYQHPAKAFLKERAAWTTPFDDEFDADNIPLALNALDLWRVGERVLAARLDGLSEQSISDAEWRRGSLPPAELGRAALAVVFNEVDQIENAVQPWRTQPRTEIDVALTGDDWSLTGTSSRVYGQHLLSWSYSSVKAKHLLAAWWELLAVTCAVPEVEWKAVVIGKRQRVVQLGPISGNFARILLADALQLRTSGLQAPLPLPPRTALQYAQSVGTAPLSEQRRRNALAALSSTWSQESDSVWTSLWGASIDDLCADPAITTETRGDVGDPTRFGTLARRIYRPLLDRANGWGR